MSVSSSKPSEQRGGRQRMRRLLSDPALVDRENHYLDIHEIIMFSNILQLLRDEPYSSMLIPFRLDNAAECLKDNRVYRNPEIYEAIRHMQAEPAVNFLYDYYLERGDLEHCLELLKAFVYVYPGQYQPYRNLAEFVTQHLKKPAAAEELWRRAYLLSGRNPEVRARMPDGMADIFR